MSRIGLYLLSVMFIDVHSEGVCRRDRVESSCTRSLLSDNIIVSPKMYSTVSTFIIQ